MKDASRVIENKLASKYVLFFLKQCLMIGMPSREDDWSANVMIIISVRERTE